MKLIEFLLLAVLFLFPLGQLERLFLPYSFSGLYFGLYFHDLIILLLLLTWLIKRKNKVWLVLKVNKSILFFSLIVFVSFIFNSLKREKFEILFAFLYLSRWLAYTGLYWLILDLKIKFLFGRKIIDWLILMGTMAAFFGLLQYVFYPDLASLLSLGWDPHYFRVVGTYFEPGFAGLIFVLTMILLVKKLWLDKNRFLLFCLFICFAAFVLTYSRSAYLAYLGGLTTLAFLKKNFKFFLIGLLIFLGSLLLLPRPGGEGVKLERQASFWSRLRSWQQGILIFKEKPLLGIGFNFYRYIAKEKGFLSENGWLTSHAGAGVDNSFIFILATTGLLGFSSYLFLLYRLFIKGNWVIKTSLVAFCLHALFNNTLFYSWLMIWFWLLMAIWVDR